MSRLSRPRPCTSCRSTTAAFSSASACAPTSHSGGQGRAGAGRPGRRRAAAARAAARAAAAAAAPGSAEEHVGRGAVALSPAHRAPEFRPLHLRDGGVVVLAPSIGFVLDERVVVAFVGRTLMHDHRGQLVRQRKWTRTFSHVGRRARPPAPPWRARPRRTSGAWPRAARSAARAGAAADRRATARTRRRAPAGHRAPPRPACCSAACRPPPVISSTPPAAARRAGRRPS